ncbi:hypothetical protein THRCLA_07135 [Thraustotheca clavata]|uniref:Uncharacterized protein n=1 Tax=Thraustotheca clavata TaxID=74557 RepID=A0A1V9ZG18_9STRA|nr:hypothetical protein THRCLA_07135 [Thraustotheca clavata]
MGEEWFVAALADTMGFTEVQDIAVFIRSLENEDEMKNALVNMLGEEKSELAASFAKKLMEEKKAHDIVQLGPIINCIGCGKIEFNGNDVCTFCGRVLEYYEDPNDGVHVQAAREHRDRLLALDASQSQRTTVIDANARFEQDKRNREAQRGNAVVDIDLVNRTVLQRAPMSDENAEMVDKLMKQLERESKKVKPQANQQEFDGVVDNEVDHSGVFY